MKSMLWGLKTRLQFTGWLQYVPTAVLASVCFVVAALGWVVGSLPALLFWPPMVAGNLLLVVFAFDVITSKFGLRPTEPIPKRRDDLDAFDLMRSRRACRSFQKRPLTDAARDELMEEVRLQTEPASLIGDRPIRFEYIAAPLTVWPVIGAHEFLVAIAPREYDRLAVIDVGRSLQHVVHHATGMGVATCWIGPGADHASILAHLGERFDPERDHIICVCAVGYASRFVPLPVRLIGRIQRRRLPIGSLFFDGPDARRPLDIEVMPFADFGRCYEVCQWAPSSFNAQPTRCAAVAEKASNGERLARVDFLASTTSRYYAPVALGIWCANWETGAGALGHRGRFVVLSPGERGVADLPELPWYDVSWVSEAPAP